MDPNYVVEDKPADLLADRDAQLPTTLGLALQGRPGGLPPPPPYPAAGVVTPEP